MTIEELLAKFLGVPVDRISDDTAMKNTPEWDSLKHVEIIVGLEQHYSIDLTGDEIAEMISLSRIKDTLHKRGL